MLPHVTGTRGSTNRCAPYHGLRSGMTRGMRERSLGRSERSLL
uniref:Uncharacterized protein n=1 Tax=Anguilla anguilla TaxID=7936 RepID=A0A0E9XDN7_ANGAN